MHDIIQKMTQKDNCANSSSLDCRNCKMLYVVCLVLHIHSNNTRRYTIGSQSSSSRKSIKHIVTNLDKFGSVISCFKRLSNCRYEQFANQKNVCLVMRQVTYLPGVRLCRRPKHCNLNCTTIPGPKVAAIFFLTIPKICGQITHL